MRRPGQAWACRNGWGHAGLDRRGRGDRRGLVGVSDETITSQRQQIGEQQTFIAGQTRFMDEQRQNLELERGDCARLRRTGGGRMPERSRRSPAGWRHD